MDIEEILYTFEDDYNPSSMVPGPRNMYSQGQLVQPNNDGSRPGYNGKKEVLSKTKFIELITKNSDKTYNEFVEILNKDYTAAGGKPFTKGIIADRARAYDLSGTLSKKEPQGRSEESKEQRRIAENKRYYERKKTEEGRAKQKKYRLNAKAKEYLNLGIDPPASTPQEALWKDAVTSAKKNKDGNGRFSFKSGYKKSMSRKDFFSNKIKIVDNVTGKTFNYNNYKSFINKNAKSFDINGYDDAIRPYKQKDFVNKTPGLRNSVNSALIPNYAKGNKTNAFTVQHNVGRQKNPLKVSLAFYDENTKEYYARDNFEKAWEKSKKSKTPLADRKKAFNIFKTEIDKLNVVSQPSMIKRNRSFGKELDLTEGLKIAKKKGAKIPYGTFKKLLTEFEAHGCKGKAAGGRILFSNGGEAVTTCATKGITRFIDDLRKGNYSKATLNLLKGGGNLIKSIANPMELLKLRNLIGPGAMGLMAAWEGGVITDDVIRQGTPLNESLSNNWLTKAFLPYTKDYAKAKNLLESGTVPSNMKKYVQDVVTFNDALMDIKGIENRKNSRLVDGSFGMIDGTSMYTKKQEQKDNADLMKKLGTLTEDVYTPGSARALEMKSLQDEMEATRMAKKEFSPIFGFDKLKDVRTPGYTGFDYIPDEQPVDLRPITYQDAEYENTKIPVGLEQLYMNKLGLKPRDSLGNYFFKDGPKKKIVYGERKQDFEEKPISILEDLTNDYNKFERQKEASKYPGYYGANENFMEGGIASLNVNKK